jgi:nitrate reductase NapE component
MDMMNMSEAANYLHVSERTLQLYIEDGIAGPGGERIKLPVHKLEPTDVASYRIELDKLRGFERQREQAIKQGKSRWINDVSNASRNQYIYYAIRILAVCILAALMVAFLGGYLWHWTWTGVVGIDKNYPNKTL